MDRAGNVLNAQLSSTGGEARVAVLKGLVTQASSAIPVMPLYISLLYRVMKDVGTHEGCIEQIDGLFRQCIYSGSPIVDEVGRWRMDGKELEDSVQHAVERLWQEVDTENLSEISDYEGYQREFLKLFGFGIPSIDYEADISTMVTL